MSETKPTILFIIGTDRSGSTALDMELGSYIGAESLGEVQWIQRYLNEDIACMCGNSLQLCPVWGKSSNDNEIPRITKPLGWKNRIRFLFSAQIDRNITGYVRAHNDIYQSILAKSGSKVLIDSTKDPTRAFILSKNEEFNYVVIYMKRSLWKYLISIKKSKQFGRVKLKKKGIVEGTLKWIGRSLECVFYFNRINGNHITVRYKLLKSQQNIQDVCNQALGPYLEKLQKKPQTEYHVLGGNLSKKKFRGFSVE